MREQMLTSIVFSPARPREDDRRADGVSGLRAIVGGMAIALVGVALYCTTGLSARPAADVDATGLTTIARWPLGVIGLGALVWACGAVGYLREAAMADDHDADRAADPRGGWQ